MHFERPFKMHKIISFSRKLEKKNKVSPVNLCRVASLNTGKFYFGLIWRPGLTVIKLFSCLTQLSMKFSLLINIKMPTIVGILTFIGSINTVLFDSILYLQSTIFQLCRDQSSWVEPVLS